MGRSRGNFNSTDEDPTQRSRRKKNVPSGESSESAASGQGAGEGKRALYHCNYCNKDISGRIRIKCFNCPDFDLCIECFSVGAEVTPHKSNHSYRVMDSLSFPLFCSDWNADEEILLLEGIEMYGLWNWTEVAEHVGTKSKANCIDHYTNIYISSPYFPLPDMSHVVGKNRKELLAMAKGNNEDKKGFSSLGEFTVKEESLFTPSRIKAEDPHKVAPSEVDPGIRSNGSIMSATTSLKKAKVKDGHANNKIEGSQIGKKFGGNKPNSKGIESPLVKLSGYNAKRHEFDPEYDNDAEQLLAEMEFKDTDTKEERELKLRVLRIYSKRLDERKRRKDFIVERNLLYPNPIEKDLSHEEISLCRQYDVFMRFHSKEEHDALLTTILGEYRTQKRIRELKEAHAAGCRTTAEADKYFERKRKREAEEKVRRVNEGVTAASPNIKGGPNAYMASESFGNDSNPRTAGHNNTPNSVHDFTNTESSAADFLSNSEQRLCNEIRIHPRLYLKMQEVISKEIFMGNVTKKSDAHHLFDCHPNKIDIVYDVLIKKGIAPS